MNALRLFCGVFAAVVVFGTQWGGWPAQAQPVPPSGAVLSRRIVATCEADTARFCPALNAAVAGGGTVMPRDRYICLKSYKASLSLGCRSAVTAYGSR